MKKLYKVILLGVLFSLALFSCSNIFNGNSSSLSIRLPGAEQSRFAFVQPETLDSYTIILTNEDAQSQEKTAKAGETITFEQIESGTYYVSAKAFDQENNCCAYAQEEVLIKPREKASVVLNLTWNLLTQYAIDNNEVDFVVTPPKKATYTLGEDFDPTGLKVEAVFKNGYRQEIPALILNETGPSDPICYKIEDLTYYKTITTTSSSRVIILNDTLFPNGEEVESIPLTLNVPKPVIITEPESETVTTSDTTTEPTCTLSIVTDYNENLGYDVTYEWYIVGNATPLEDTADGETETPKYAGVNTESLTITFAPDDTKTYQYYCEVTNSISKPPSVTPGVTYGTETATTKSNIVTVTTNGSSSGSGTTTTPSYSIGDVYPQTGTPMGVVFEVAENNSYIKIVALEEDSNISFAESGCIGTTDAQYFLDNDDGSKNKIGLGTVISNNATYGYNISYYPAFDFCNSYTVLSDKSDINTWYLPAINEILAIIQTNFSAINASIITENGTELSTTYGYASSTMQEESTNYYYCTTRTEGSQTCNVQTGRYVRPVKKIAL